MAIRDLKMPLGLGTEPLLALQLSEFQLTMCDRELARSAAQRPGGGGIQKHLIDAIDVLIEHLQPSTAAGETERSGSETPGPTRQPP